MYWPVSWGYGMRLLHLLRGVGPPMSVLDVRLNCLMVGSQWCWGLGECGAPLISALARRGGTWWGPICGLGGASGVLVLDWIVWLNWIAWNRNVFDGWTVLTFGLSVYAKLNYFEWNYFLTLKLCLHWTELFSMELFWQLALCEQVLCLY